MDQSNDRLLEAELLGRNPVAQRALSGDPSLSDSRFLEFQQFAWLQLNAESSPSLAEDFVFSGLFSPHEIVRVASAAVIAPLLSEPSNIVQNILLDGTYSDSETIRGMSTVVLEEQLEPRRGEPEVQLPDTDYGVSPPPTVSLIVHGTFSRWDKKRRKKKSQWWRPGDDFFEYAKEKFAADLYSRDDYFRWSGGYHELDRQQGADNLQGWMNKKSNGMARITLAHSYGSEVVLRATSQNPALAPFRSRFTVLLSAPATIPKGVELGLLGRIVSIRVAFDFVILAARKPQRYRNYEIQELRVPIKPWFGHGATHDPEVWKLLDLDSEIRYELSQA